MFNIFCPSLICEGVGGDFPEVTELLFVLAQLLVREYFVAPLVRAQVLHFLDQHLGGQVKVLPHGPPARGAV